jgi:hypothetical protein
MSSSSSRLYRLNVQYLILAINIADLDSRGPVSGFRLRIRDDDLHTKRRKSKELSYFEELFGGLKVGSGSAGLLT